MLVLSHIHLVQLITSFRQLTCNGRRPSVARGACSSVLCVWKGKLMLHKCANPVCSNRFLRIREGKLFQVETEFVPNSNKPATNRRRQKLGLRRIEYYWLCNQCAPYVTLVADPTQGIITIPLPEGLARRTVIERPTQKMDELSENVASLIGASDS